MTLANKITISRFIFIPLMILGAYLGAFVGPTMYPLFLGVSGGQIVFAFFFIMGAATDFLDGYFARKRHEVTTFGKFLDPLLDKILVLSALFLLLFFPYYNNDFILRVLIITTGIVIFTREFLVCGIRLVAIARRNVIAASIWGKIKTACTMIGLIILLFNAFNFRVLTNSKTCYLTISILALIMFVTIISGLDYIKKSKLFLKIAVTTKSKEFCYERAYFKKIK